MLSAPLRHDSQFSSFFREHWWEGGGGLWPILLEFGPGLLDFNLILLPKSLAFVFVSHVRRVSLLDSAVHGVMILAVLEQDPIKP